jgi:hypothetical protein
VNRYETHLLAMLDFRIILEARRRAWLRQAQEKWAELMDRRA